MGNGNSDIGDPLKLGKEFDLLNYFRLSEESNLFPDVGIDFSLMKYSGLNSAAVLENSLKEMANSIPGHVESLGSALAAFNSVPSAVGLGALTLAMLLEVIFKSREERKDRTVDMLWRVFAEEKAAGVRDLMDEYLKRLRMYLNQPSQALEETERLEKQLSDQLTRLKNSMLHDNQMSSRSLKHWTNGAAFHLQMLIHAARQKFQSSTEDTQLQVHQASITSVLLSYQYSLEELLKQYKTYKKSTISIYPYEPHYIFPVYIPEEIPKRVIDEELKRETSSLYLRCKITSSEYVDYMFARWKQLRKLKSYFSDLKGNLKDLIKQNYEFNMLKVLPVLNKQGV